MSYDNIGKAKDLPHIRHILEKGLSVSKELFWDLFYQELIESTPTIQYNFIALVQTLLLRYANLEQITAQNAKAVQFAKLVAKNVGNIIPI